MCVPIPPHPLAYFVIYLLIPFPFLVWFLHLVVTLAVRDAVRLIPCRHLEITGSLMWMEESERVNYYFLSLF